MQFLSATDYSTLDALIKAVQAYKIVKEDAVLKRRSKADYNLDTISKVDKICERDNKLRRKSNVK
jgi:hydroxyethylthiazole kinase-like sugar kinase family protein